MAAAISVQRGPGRDLPRVAVYCGRPNLISDLTGGLNRMDCHFELHLESGKFMEAARERRPEVLVLCFAADEGWAEVGIIALSRSCPGVKIIYSTENPGMDDIKGLARGVFYYAGGAPCRDVLSAVRAALKSSSRRGDPG